MSTPTSKSGRTTGIILTAAFFLGAHSTSLYSGNITILTPKEYTEGNDCENQLITDNRINLVAPFLPNEDKESYYVYDCKKR